MRKTLIAALVAAAICTAAVWAADAKPAGPWVLALEGTDPLAPRAVLVVESSPAGALSAGAYLSMADTKATAADAGKLVRKDAALTGDVTLSRPAAKAGDPAVRCVYTLDVTVADGKADGTYTGTEGETQVAGKVTWGADRLPLGHPRFYPSAVRPVGFRGDGTNVYPGATLVPSFDERTGKNVLWKMEIPAWSSSGLIAVGDKLFTVGEPYTVFCFSAKDGKLLWQRDLNPFASAGLTGEKLVEATELYEVVAALRLISYHAFTPAKTASKAFDWAQAITYLKALKAKAAPLVPGSGPGFDELIAIYEQCGRGEPHAGLESAYAKYVKLPSPMGVPLTLCTTPVGMDGRWFFHVGAGYSGMVMMTTDGGDFTQVGLRMPTVKSWIPLPGGTNATTKLDYCLTSTPAMANGFMYFRGSDSIWCYDLRKSITETK